MKNLKQKCEKEQLRTELIWLDIIQVGRCEKGNNWEEICRKLRKIKSRKREREREIEGKKKKKNFFEKKVKEKLERE